MNASHPFRYRQPTNGGQIAAVAPLFRAKARATLLIPVLLFAAGNIFAQTGASVRHELSVTVEPARHILRVRDRLTVPGGGGREISFLLHRGLNPRPTTAGVLLRRDKTGPAPHLELYRLKLPAGTESLELEYGGEIRHELKERPREYARGFEETPGLISETGVYLTGATGWIPEFDGRNVVFALRLHLPAGWKSMSQGRRRVIADDARSGATVEWTCDFPQEEIYLIAGKFTEYGEKKGRIEALVLLRKKDDALAAKYLEATHRYIAMYEELIGPYPYGKFALVENFWETGYGMPSFTLLGPTVIRLPFIVNTSYPHEILHNWWGNGVYPDYRQGNWSEGLTAYLADHLLAENQGRGAEYRRTTLQKYADYVGENRDFPLSKFLSRHTTASESIGYGKSALFFHMLRRTLGDRTFISGLREFYKAYKFRTASFSDLRKSFERVSRRNLDTEFRQWVERSGAPRLTLERVRSGRRGDRPTLAFTLRQRQPGAVYRLEIPVRITMRGHSKARMETIAMNTRGKTVVLRLPAPAIRVDVDPEYDLFRRLDRRESPPALSRLFGASRVLILLPSGIPERLRKPYASLARSFNRMGPTAIEIRSDREFSRLPAGRPVVILDRRNRFFSELRRSLREYPISFEKDGVKIGENMTAWKNHSLVLAADRSDDESLPLLGVTIDNPDAVSPLARKLPHYHKYSYLGFSGSGSENVLKGLWPILKSPLTAFPGRRGKGKRPAPGRTPKRKPLISPPPIFSAARMMETVRFLADTRQGGRPAGKDVIERSADYIAEQFQKIGLREGGDPGRGYRQSWSEPIPPDPKPRPLTNIIGLVPGQLPELPCLLVGAHYDHLGREHPAIRGEFKGRLHPGADDNASGVALLLELARIFAGSRPDRTIVFAAFTGEESGRLGSRRFIARATQAPYGRCYGMINIDTVGQLASRPLLILGTQSAREWIHIFRGAGYLTGVRIKDVSSELDSGDHISFREANIPAVQIFAGPTLDYHTPRDTADKIDAAGLQTTAMLLREALDYLDSRNGKLTGESGRTPSTAAGPNSAAGGQSGESGSTGSHGARRVSLGTVPDFAHKGRGYRLSGVVPGSPAAIAGLKKGDVIVGIDQRKIADIRDLSRVLRLLKPGRTVTIRFLRAGRSESVLLTPGAR